MHRFSSPVASLVHIFPSGCSWFQNTLPLTIIDMCSVSVARIPWHFQKSFTWIVFDNSAVWLWKGCYALFFPSANRRLCLKSCWNSFDISCYVAKCLSEFLMIYSDSSFWSKFLVVNRKEIWALSLISFGVSSMLASLALKMLILFWREWRRKRYISSGIYYIRYIGSANNLFMGPSFKE
jgi:hypothetical protein